MIGVKQNVIIGKLFGEGFVEINVNSHLNEDMLSLIGEKFEVVINSSVGKKLESKLEELEKMVSKESDLKPRAPVVTILGHAALLRLFFRRRAGGNGLDHGGGCAGQVPNPLPGTTS